jgi:hypothetical protein
MTQRHFLDAVTDDESLDPLFRACCATVGARRRSAPSTHMVDALAEGARRAGIAAGVDAYLSIGGFLDGGLARQVEFDLDALERASGRKLGGAERAELVKSQHRPPLDLPRLRHVAPCSWNGRPFSPAQRTRLGGSPRRSREWFRWWRGRRRGGADDQVSATTPPASLVVEPRCGGVQNLELNEGQEH